MTTLRLSATLDAAARTRERARPFSSILTPHSSLLLLALCPALLAQKTTPHVGYVYPAGGRQGSTFEVTVGGQFLDGVTAVLLSGPGVQAKVVKLIKPMTNGQYMKLRDDLKELTDKKAAATKHQRGTEPQTSAKVPWTAQDEKTMADIREKLANGVRRPANPAIAELVNVQVTLAADALPGERELRLNTSQGLTNPVVFCIAQLPEISKPSEKPQSELKNKSRYQRAPEEKEIAPPTPVALPAILNGQMEPGGVDRYKFKASKGQNIVAMAGVRQLIPYISDAVPGWFQATLALYDAKGKEIEYAGHFRFNQDPVLHYEVLSDGEYVIEIRDSIYRGREDFVYRIAIGELPFVTSIFPLGGKTGSKTTVELTGWNLPSTKITEDSKKKAPGTYPVFVSTGQWTSNRLPFVIDTLQERTTKESNKDVKSAQTVKIPLILNGRIEKPGAWDVFRLDGHAGEEIVAEVFARRLESPLDSILKLTDANGKLLAINDDFDDKSAGLITHQADSRILYKLPANGTYYLHLGDTQSKGGPEYAYRLRISRPQPDFDLRVVPSSLNVRGGATVPISVYAIRKDGFAGEITLALKDAPPGFSLSGGWVPANQDKVRLTLTVPSSRMDKPLKLRLEGRSTIQGKQVVRSGIPAEYQEQAFAYHHLVPESDWMVRITGGSRSKKTPRTPAGAWKLADSRVMLPSGGTAPVRVVIPNIQYAGEATLELNEPPEGITIQNISYARDTVAITLRADPLKAKPGLKGNLIVDAFVEMTRQTKGKADKRRVPLGTLPAIQFEIIPGAQIGQVRQ